MFRCHPDELIGAAQKVARLESTVNRDAEYRAFSELTTILDNLNVTRNDPVMGPLRARLDDYEHSPVPTDVIRLLGDHIYAAWRFTTILQMDVDRHCLRSANGLPYTG